MRAKLSLNLDDLSVDSFDTTTAEKAKGTVFGEQCTCYTNCTCPGCPTCYASCNGTCDASCNGTCGGSCAGTCDASCNGTCDAYCYGTVNDYTCAPYGTCGARYCAEVP
ncbi:MAG TPA: hypothetical protein VGC13_32190 [Longimicrobium sp.]|jgi:hypothetical protein|uniref:hypothetical protein n=1 Tax=Longimicrobium sp. TaxID=2029185 RepID=UPI002EDAAD94